MDKEQLIEAMLDCIFPTDYYSGEREPVGVNPEPLINEVGIVDAYGVAAKNLRPMAEIAGRLHALGLEGGFITNLTHALEAKLKETVEIAHMSTSSDGTLGTQHVIHFEDNPDASFGLNIKTEGVNYTEQNIADLKKWIGGLLAFNYERDSSQFDLRKNRQQAQQVKVLNGLNKTLS